MLDALLYNIHKLTYIFYYHYIVAVMSNTFLDVGIYLKLAWNFVTNPNKLWFRLMKVKYVCGPNVFLDVCMKKKCSNI